MPTDGLPTLKQPEYTGENRCEPCTVLNLAIAGILGSAIARKSRIGGVLAVGISVALIYLRGYLVPGTPALTKKHLPPEVLAWFGKEPQPTTKQGFGSYGEPNETDSDSFSPDEPAPESDTEETTLEPEPFLVESGILAPCQERDDLCLTERFEKTWQAKMESIDPESVSASDAATAFGLTADDEYTIESFDEAQVLRRDGEQVGQWPSHAALVADVVGARAMEERTSDWEPLPPEAKGQLLNALRLFLESCPTSDGDVAIETETVESCCHSYDVVAAVCTDTGERLFEQQVDEL